MASRAAAEPDDGRTDAEASVGGPRPLRPVVLGMAVVAGVMFVIAVVAATVSGEPLRGFLGVPVGFAVGWGVTALTHAFIPYGDRQIERARARPTAEFEAVPRTVVVAVVSGVIAAAAGLAVMAVLGSEPGLAAFILAGTSAQQAYIAWRNARWERESGRRLLAEPGVHLRGATLVAVPAAGVSPAARRATAGG